MGRKDGMEQRCDLVCEVVGIGMVVGWLGRTCGTGAQDGVGGIRGDGNGTAGGRRYEGSWDSRELLGSI